MFQLIRSLRIDVEAGRAEAVAYVSRHRLFKDHFPGAPLMPGSLMIELAAQVSGPLAEEFAKTRMGNQRMAMLGMVRDARFLVPVFLPATLVLSAEVSRSEPSTISTNVIVKVRDERVMQGQFVMMMMELSPEWAEALEARYRRLRRWKDNERNEIISD
jgi:3-hydroxymyristoyl/3-hydroxydecanoyl-(acyl carrier protein) dehydratase